ncbi:pitrilysin family protein [Flavivirga sp. 57AJ16]|uniref:M16 family metallopeptidase n=1 Tax=Flavivirga sp. 57AJ16 TaxID=3025307 RepID=UPI0023663ADE|nr:insulinase family protein [Flavivirga sp. 57AJ16]MDD7885417.1 insulinase family protein [Flavivirga sp. 57AJ16]
MKNIPPTILLTINVLLFSINSHAQSLDLKDSLQTEQSLKKGILNNVKKMEGDTAFMPYKEAAIEKTLMSGLTIKEGHIISENMLQSMGSTTFTLSNGIKVHYKYTNKNKNDVQLKAISYGGLSLVKDEDLPSAQVLGDVMAVSGLGDYSAADLTKKLEGKKASTQIRLSNITEDISGTSTTKDVETLLQMIHLRFVKPRFDVDAYQVFMGNLNNVMGRSQIINDRIKDSMTVALYGNNHPRKRLFNNDFLKDVSFDKIKAVYKERFKNVADFEFFIVGDIQKGRLRPLLEKYMASIPTSHVKETWQDHSVPWLQDTIDKEILLATAPPKSIVKMGYQNVMPYSLKNEFIARVLGEILQLRFSETLQKETGESHHASVKVNVSKRPIEQVSLLLAFDCDPNQTEQLTTMVLQEIEKVIKGDIVQTDLDQTKANYLKERKKQKDNNSYDMRLLINYFREGYHMNDPKKFEDLLKTITTKDVEVFTKTFIKDVQFYKVVFK